MGPARLSLYLIAMTAGIAAIITWRNRSKTIIETAASAGKRPRIEKLASVLHEAWGDYRTTP
jgi:hypothetical protein